MLFSNFVEKLDHTAATPGSGHISAMRIAEERYARGEVSAADFAQVRSDLQAAP